VYDARAREPVTTDHYFRITCDQPDGVYCLGVHQVDTRIEGSPPNIDLGVIVVNDSNGKVVADTGLEINRENQVHVTLSQGTYTVFPYSSGCKLAQFKEAKRDYYMTIHCDDESSCVLTEIAADPFLLHQARKEDMLVDAQKRTVAPGLDIYTYWNGSVYALALHCSDKCAATGAELSFDCSKSQNAISHRGNMVHKAKVLKGEFYIYHNLAPIENYEAVSCSYGMSGGYIQ